MNSKKILISAYACSPYQGSEGAVGWGYVSILLQYFEVHVVVEEVKFKSDLESYFRDNQQPSNLHIYYVKKQRSRLLRKLYPPSYYLFYNIWQIKVLALAKQLDKVHNFYACHHLTLVGFRQPGYLFYLNKKFIWGPIGGLQSFPIHLFPLLPLGSKLYYIIYNLLNLWDKRFNLQVKNATNAASSILVASMHEKEAFQKLSHRSLTILPEIGIDCKQISTTPSSVRQKNSPLKLLWVGQFIPRKCPQLLLKALLTLSNDVDYRCDMYGNGPLKRTAISLLKKYNLESKVQIKGVVPRSIILRRMRQSHALIITSLREINSMISVEAMASGLPIICLDTFAFAESLRAGAGIVISTEDCSDVHIKVADAIRFLYHNEESRANMSSIALKVARSFSWEAKSNTLLKAYGYTS